MNKEELEKASKIVSTATNVLVKSKPKMAYMISTNKTGIKILKGNKKGYNEYHISLNKLVDLICKEKYEVINNE